MTDQIAIYNLALDAIGSQSTVSSPMETSAEANALNRHWLPAIRQILRAVHWNFARYQRAMTLLKDASIGGTTPAPWVYEYAYPNDCLLARYIMPNLDGALGEITVGPTVRFLVSSDNDTSNNPITVLLTNQPQAVLVYTRLIENPTLFDDEFIEALRQYIGARIAIALTGDRDKRDDCYAKATAAVEGARARNGNESVKVMEHVPDWIRVRGYAPDFAYPDGSLYYTEPQSLALIA